MIDGPGLRERKKQRTRQALTDAAYQLFRDNGYEQTTVAEIAAAADVSTKTFFNYFPSKEDVLFADLRLRIDTAVRAIEQRADGETPAETLMRIKERLVELLGTDAAIDIEQATVRARLAVTIPAVQARLLQVLFGTQRELAASLHKAYPERLDHVTASAAIGSLVGAAQGALLAAAEDGVGPDATLGVMERSFDIAMRGIDAVTRG